MKKGRKYTREEIELISKSAIGKTFGEIKNSEVVHVGDDDNKGGMGQLIETYLFGIDTNSDSEPDFLDAGIELKVTPYKRNKNNTLSAKERLVLNIIDYMTEYKNEFKTSHFWFKNNKLQILWYLANDGTSTKEERMNFIVTNEHLLDLSISEDLEQIEADWSFIINKIKECKAHELSEADTMYLGACTKGANSSSLRKQPFSDELAMQRAFDFKIGYMTQLVRKYIGDYSNVEHLLRDTKESFIDYIKNVTKQYIGKSQVELINTFRLDIKSKDTKGIYPMIINRMFNLNGNIENTDEFKKANIKLKTIRVENNGRVKESMSFPTFEFKELIKEYWEESEVRNEFETTKYLLCVFENDGHDYIFKGVKLWNMPETIIESKVKSCWLKTKDTIINGVKFEITDRDVKNNLPGVSDNGVIHVRPHAGKSAYQLNNGFKKGNIKKYASELPNGEWMTRQCFWLNREYIKSIINDMLK